MGPFEVTSETGVDWIVSNHALRDSLEDSIASFIAITKLRIGHWVQFCRPRRSNSATRQNTNPVSRKTSRMLIAHAYVHSYSWLATT